MITHIKKYWIAYLILVVILITIIVYNWETIKGWFTKEDLFDGTPRYDQDGKLINPGTSTGRAGACPVNCLVPTSQPGLFRCASPCNLTS